MKRQFLNLQRCGRGGVLRLSLMLLAFLLCSTAYSESTDFLTLKTSKGGEWTSSTGVVTKNKVSVSFTGFTLNSQNMGLSSGEGTLNVDAPDATLTKVSVYFQKNKYFGTASTDTEGWTVTNTSSVSQPTVCTGTGSSVKLTFTGNTRIVKVTVEYTTKPAPVLTLSGIKESIMLADGPFDIKVSAALDGKSFNAKDIKFSSSDETVATVSQSGRVTPVAGGVTTISATYAGNDTYGSASASFTLAVYKGEGLSPYDENRPVGWAEGVTGGANGKVYLADTRAKLLAALQGDEPATVYVKGTIYFSGADTLQSVKNKTIIGLPGAKFRNAVARYGTLADNPTYKGGNYKKYLTTQADRDKVWAWIKTTMSIDSTGILCLKECDNIIIRNIEFEGEGDFDLDGKDNLTLHGSTNIWVDHCSFHDGIDGNFDCIHGSDNIAVTWCHFYYDKESRVGVKNGVTGDANGGHKDSNLWGHTDNNPEDEGKLNTTFANCWWGKMCYDRMPRVRYGKVHIYNCFYNSDNKDISGTIVPASNSNVTAENCVFENYAATKTPNTKKGGKLTLTNWLVSGVKQKNITGSNFTPTYSYRKYDVEQTKTVVTNIDNGAGPTLDTTLPDATDDPTSIDVTMKNELATLCCPYPLDFSNVSGLKAYVATELVTTTSGDVLLKSVKLKQVEKVPGGTGIILKGTAGRTYSVPVADENSVSEPAVNYLEGTIQKKYIGMNYDYYVDESSAFHHKVSDDFVLKSGNFHPCYPGYLAGGKAYLAAPKGTIANYQKPGLAAAYAPIIFEDDAAGIEEVNKPAANDDAWYTLTGVKVQHPQKGVYIRGGRKVIVK